MKTDATERRFLLLSAGGNLASALLGLIFAVLASSQAILLDGLFDITYFVMALFTLKVARIVHRVDDERFPFGYAFFEPLTNGLKGVLVLGISIMAVAGAIEALLGGGRTIATGTAILYGFLAAVLCVGMAWVIHRRSQKIQSPLLRADAKNWVVSGVISAAMMLAFASALLLDRIPSMQWLVPYVDPLIVLAVVLLTISVPVRIAWQALMELLNRAPSEDVVQQTSEAVDRATATLPVQERFVRVLQPGRMRLVLVYVVLPEDHPPQSLTALDAVRAQTLRQLRQIYPTTTLDMVFTADRRWGEPAGLTQADELTASLDSAD